tara:strand:+ start:214 stop:1068 length:855 start_codon:yes stop_codon:yes gene_type:complete
MRLCLALTLLLWQTLVLADTSVWKVSKGEQSLFIGGTLHILAPSDYPLPDSFSTSYQQAQTLVFETDLSALSSPEFQLQMLTALTYPDGKNLKSVLEEDTYQRLNTYCQARDLPLDNFLKFKPALLTITLTMIELQRMGISSAGVDEHFYKQGTKDGKTLLKLETTEQQLQFLTSMGEGQEDQLILSTLDDMDSLAKMMATLKSAWRSGDSNKLLETAIMPISSDYPELYQNLLVSRNNSWLPQIEAMFKTPATEFILVGTLHLVGPDGIIERLQKSGYRVEQL